MILKGPPQLNHPFQMLTFLIPTELNHLFQMLTFFPGEQKEIAQLTCECERHIGTQSGGMDQVTDDLLIPKSQ